MNYKLNVGWLYPELMSTYGDRGNIIVLRKRCEWRGIEVKIQTIDFETRSGVVEKCDLIFGGGAQDRQQRILIDDLREKKGPVLKMMFDRGVPGLFVCGAPQLLGHWYTTGDGQRLKGLGIFDMVTKHFGHDKPRCIGNLVAELITQTPMTREFKKNTIVGFENHGGRTYINLELRTENSELNNIRTVTMPLGRVIKGYGNNGEDGTEGAVYNNCIATYMHGPFLPKNSHIADWLISKALEIKYQTKITLTELDDTLEWRAHEFVVNKCG